MKILSMRTSLLFSTSFLFSALALASNLSIPFYFDNAKVLPKGDTQPTLQLLDGRS